MQIFIGKIPNHVSEEQIKEYFGQFGEVTDVSLKGTYGFLNFDSESSITRVLNQRSHAIDGAPISVERANGRKRPLDSEYHDRYMDMGRGGYSPRDYRGFRNAPYPPMRYEDRSPGRYDPRFPDRYGGRSPSYRGDGFRGDPQRSRDFCEYCNSCPIHGVREVIDPRKRVHASRDHPNNHLKVVFENVAPNTTIEDFKNFVHDNGFEPSYARLGYSGNHAVLEFKNIEDKDNVMKKLDGVEFNGHVLKTRSYLSKDEYKSRERESYMRNEQQPNESNSVEPQETGTDIYEGIEEPKAEND
ncbi:hypothetical protein EHEL_051570 [Encephalitozoon hellem ATCC 50504]|uniref:RRM domain-containing protein n=1 Tax=Encephalitozoon hellem TaxID=27973 RepID=A0A9Q9C342_ENCHE|nr:uncharacterized protein EHEL_051570 [Encephalitozoon hellem ATCC 50504]AFM98365.1 hypothetical protein EHEL_051570 [Encephalitozoon hellem ATCC 50504]UTX43246.1 RRM domain-containing protein [Encephalitozoon hellem]|eukprot:XP_003887346.1 hypothetical protein EHEL_051570 [Encephalitozoon hellem ATCC 50504]